MVRHKASSRWRCLRRVMRRGTVGERKWGNGQLAPAHTSDAETRRCWTLDAGGWTLRAAVGRPCALPAFQCRRCAGVAVLAPDPAPRGSPAAQLAAARAPEPQQLSRLGSDEELWRAGGRGALLFWPLLPPTLAGCRRNCTAQSAAELPASGRAQLRTLHGSSRGSRRVYG